MKLAKCRDTGKIKNKERAYMAVDTQITAKLHSGHFYHYWITREFHSANAPHTGHHLLLHNHLPPRQLHPGIVGTLLPNHSCYSLPL